MMICYSLFIKARFCSEVLERILRVIRHRGFELYSLNMMSSQKSHNKQMILFLTVLGNRKIHVLHSQINKLIDVNYVEIR